MASSSSSSSSPSSHSPPTPLPFPLPSSPPSSYLYPPPTSIPQLPVDDDDPLTTFTTSLDMELALAMESQRKRQLAQQKHGESLREKLVRKSQMKKGAISQPKPMGNGNPKEKNPNIIVVQTLISSNNMSIMEKKSSSSPSPSLLPQSECSPLPLPLSSPSIPPSKRLPKSHLMHHSIDVFSMSDSLSPRFNAIGKPNSVRFHKKANSTVSPSEVTNIHGKSHSQSNGAMHSSAQIQERSISEDGDAQEDGESEVRISPFPAMDIPMNIDMNTNIIDDHTNALPQGLSFSDGNHHNEQKYNKKSDDDGDGSLRSNPISPSSLSSSSVSSPLPLPSHFSMTMSASMSFSTSASASPSSASMTAGSQFSLSSLSMTSNGNSQQKHFAQEKEKEREKEREENKFHSLSSFPSSSSPPRPSRFPHLPLAYSSPVGSPGKYTGSLMALSGNGNVTEPDHSR